jgi:hypothetical protein
MPGSTHWPNKTSRYLSKPISWVKTPVGLKGTPTNALRKLESAPGSHRAFGRAVIAREGYEAIDDRTGVRNRDPRRPAHAADAPDPSDIDRPERLWDGAIAPLPSASTDMRCRHHPCELPLNLVVGYPVGSRLHRERLWLWASTPISHARRCSTL